MLAIICSVELNDVFHSFHFYGYQVYLTSHVAHNAHTNLFRKNREINFGTRENETESSISDSMLNNIKIKRNTNFHFFYFFSQQSLSVLIQSFQQTRLIINLNLKPYDFPNGNFNDVNGRCDFLNGTFREYRSVFGMIIEL